MMHEFGDASYLSFHGRDGRNIALQKATTQSSWIGEAPDKEFADEAVAGVVTGAASFHTEADDKPWWMVDLGATMAISKIRVFNRMDVRHRADGLIVVTSDDLRKWRVAGQHEGESFGGADGNPLVIEVGHSARFIRLEIPRREYLHLDQVQVLRPITHKRSPWFTND